MFSRRAPLSLALLLLTAGCSSSSSNNGTPGQSDDSGDTTPSDAGGSSSSSGGGNDATVNGDSSTHPPAVVGNSSSPHDAGSALPFDASTSGDAGVAAVCAGLCGSLEQCAATLDAGPAQPCHCGVTGTQLLREDYVQALTNCISSTITANCSLVASDGGADSVVDGCETTVQANINPTPTAAMFCKNLGLGFCAGAITGCEAQIFTYSDPTIMAAANCLPDVPDAALDGGCNSFAACLNAAFTP
jgi:hypothetical protein